MKSLSPKEYQSGPLVWVGVIAATCLVLFFFQQILWLVVPFLLALIMYYALLPLKQRLVLSGFSHDAAASMVSVAVGVLIALLLVFSL
ncbi:MAG: hypothetical protein H6R18_3051, partial [Proteobacteria bacterium]|nr:hypothetical protein [Pseudomonadota bacterium]